MITTYDVIVVGSGPSGASASETLVRAGLSVCMLDVGITNQKDDSTIPDKSFVELRTTDNNQHAYFLGKHFEGLSFKEIESGAQLTPGRKYTTTGGNVLTPTSTDTFSKVESLAYGGLGGAWGLGAFTLEDAELIKLGLAPRDMKDAYGVVARRMGVSASLDDVTPYSLHALEPSDIQPATKMERGISALFGAYQKRRPKLNRLGVFVGRTPLALLTKAIGERLATRYTDMDFWKNEGDSAYRPSITIDALRKEKNFFYCGGYLVTSFREVTEGVEVTALCVASLKSETFLCRKLVLTAGVFGTARIVLRSLGNAGQRLPIVCGAYVYYPSIQPRMFGVGVEKSKISYSQLVLFLKRGKDVLDTAAVQFYTYSSLMLHRLAPELPLNFADAQKLLYLGAPNLIVAGLHMPGVRGNDKYIELVPDDTSHTKDRLHIHYAESKEEKEKRNETERIVKRALRMLGCYPVKRIDPKPGASIHYGGTLPYSTEGGAFTLSPQGVLHGTSNVLVADASGFNYMPPKGPTLTIMANAHNVAKFIISSFQHHD